MWQDRIINQQKRIITDYRERLGHYLSTLSELLRGAVKAVIEFVESGSRSFTFFQKGDIKRYMNGQLDKEEAAGTVYNASPPFSESGRM